MTVEQEKVMLKISKNIKICNEEALRSNQSLVHIDNAIEGAWLGAEIA